MLSRLGSLRGSIGVLNHSLPLVGPQAGSARQTARSALDAFMMPDAYTGLEDRRAGGELAAPAAAGAGGVGGAPEQPAGGVSLPQLAGTWTGHLLGSYVCETGVNEIELSIEGSSVTSNWPSVEDPGTGEIIKRGAQSFTFGLFIDNPSFNQVPTRTAPLRPPPGGVQDEQVAVGVWVAANVIQGEQEQRPMYLMSDDAQVIAVAQLTDQDENNGALCTLDDPYADMSVHKFALWQRVVEER
jgi:hypothetical protein